jgi:hypothetical protein
MVMQKLKRRVPRSNNRAYLSYRMARQELKAGFSKVAEWYAELEHYGFIVLAAHGSLGVDGKGKAPHWRLTELGHVAGSGTDFPTKEYLHQLTGASTWILPQPRVGNLVTIYAAATMSTANITIVSTSTGGQVAFNSLGGTQKLVLTPTTVGGGEDMSVTLLGESSTQWRIVSAWPKLSADSTTNGVKVTT